MASMRMLAVSLARDAVFGREEWAKTSLGSRKGSDLQPANKEKMDYIKTLIYSRMPKKSKVRVRICMEPMQGVRFVKIGSSSSYKS